MFGPSTNGRETNERWKRTHFSLFFSTALRCVVAWQVQTRSGICFCLLSRKLLSVGKFFILFLWYSTQGSRRRDAQYGENMKIDNKNTAFNLESLFPFTQTTAQCTCAALMCWPFCCALLAANICAITAWHIRAISQHIWCPPTACETARCAFDRTRKIHHRMLRRVRLAWVNVATARTPLILVVHSRKHLFIIVSPVVIALPPNGDKRN